MIAGNFFRLLLNGLRGQACGRVSNAVIAYFMSFVNHPLNQVRILGCKRFGYKKDSMYIFFFQCIQNPRRTAIFVTLINGEVNYLFLRFIHDKVSIALSVFLLILHTACRPVPLVFVSALSPVQAGSVQSVQVKLRILQYNSLFRGSGVKSFRVIQISQYKRFVLFFLFVLAFTFRMLRKAVLLFSGFFFLFFFFSGLFFLLFFAGLFFLFLLFPLICGFYSAGDAHNNSKYYDYRNYAGEEAEFLISPSPASLSSFLHKIFLCLSFKNWLLPRYGAGL